jgi:glycosyltransferase involved in cell wall biosynthesis
MLQSCDLVICVSKFTKNKVIEMQGVKMEKCAILNNCLDPFLPIPKLKIKLSELRKRYGITEEHKILFTLTRISARERYKGYDKVLEALASLKTTIPNIRYLVAGRYDAKEKSLLDEKVIELGLQDIVIIPGFIPENEIAAHFTLADIYIMPSKKEGFGIVFIEAMFYGLPIIAGNKDGSTDALLNGKLGLLVDPDNVNEIASAVRKISSDNVSFIPDRFILAENFSYEAYKNKLEQILQAISKKDMNVSIQHTFLQKNNDKNRAGTLGPGHTA